MNRISLNRANAILIFVVLSIGILYVGRTFLVPLTFALILTFLLIPVSQKLERWGVGRAWATLLCVLLFLAFVAIYGWIIYAQIASFANDWPQMQLKLKESIEKLQQFIQREFNVTPKRQMQALRDGISRLSSSGGTFIQSALGGLAGLLAGLVLVVLYLFFLLWKREKFKAFLLKLAPSDSRPTMNHALSEIRRVSARYLIGRLISMAFLALFYAIGLSIIGLKNAVLMSLVSVIPTLIPYLGAYVGASFPLFMALMDGSSNLLMPTVAILIVAQIIDNNIIEPLVMGAELDLSPIFTIIAIVLGELIWGIPGMILFEPLFAIIRITCAHIPALHPYNFLLENEVEEPKWVGKVKKWVS